MLAGAGELKRYGTGKQLVGSGERSDGVWLITKGGVRSMAQLPPKGDWRTVQRHGVGELVGWLGLIQGQPLEHLRTSDLTETEFIPADQFLQLWETQPDLRQWCAQQMPAIEVVDLMIRLAQANPARARQLEECAMP